MGKGTVLNKADIFKIRPVSHVETVEVEEFPGVVFGIKVMSAGARDDYDNSMFELEDKADGGFKVKPVRKDARLRLILHTVCDPSTGALLFDETDIPELREFPGPAIQTLFDAASKLNALSKDKDEGKEMEKN